MSEDYRALAQHNLEQAAQQLGTLPQGRVRTDEMLACSAKAQALASAAIAQALLHLGDSLASPSTAVADAVDLVDVATCSDREPRYVLGETTYKALLSMGWTPPAATERD